MGEICLDLDCTPKFGSPGFRNLINTLDMDASVLLFYKLKVKVVMRGLNGNDGVVRAVLLVRAVGGGAFWLKRGNDGHGRDGLLRHGS